MSEDMCNVLTCFSELINSEILMEAAQKSSCFASLYIRREVENVLISPVWIAGVCTTRRHCF